MKRPSREFFIWSVLLAFASFGIYRQVSFDMSMNTFFDLAVLLMLANVIIAIIKLTEARLPEAIPGSRIRISESRHFARILQRFDRETQIGFARAGAPDDTPAIV
jgi:hypothetical protein